jgi:hypothetical protein
MFSPISVVDSPRREWRKSLVNHEMWQIAAAMRAELGSFDGQWDQSVYVRFMKGGRNEIHTT